MTTASHHTVSRMAITAREGSICCNFDVDVFFTITSAIPQTERNRHHTLAQADSGFGSTMMVICPLACAVQAN